MKPVYFAPLQGVTDAVFRRAHAARFPGVAKYFIPFVSPTCDLRFTARELREVAPARNAGVFAVPQVLARDAETFLWAAETLWDMGYAEVNLNLGCPSGTVTAKGKGAGMLRDLAALARFLDAVCARLRGKLSVKTRVGYADPSEFPALLALLSRYPLCEVIVHPRTRAEFYGGAPHADVFRAALETARLPLCYNGDLREAEDCRALLKDCPGAHALMIGRGLVADPALARELSGGPPLAREELRAFLGALLDGWLAEQPPNVAVARTCEAAKYAAERFDGAEKPKKLLRKAKTLSAYREAEARLFDCPLRGEGRPREA